MELQINKFIGIGIILLFLCSCSKNRSIEGNWGAMDSDGNYFELYFEENNIRIYTDIAGAISSQTFYIKGDSLFTNISDYKIDQINSDSIVLSSKQVTFYLSRIETGFKLSDFKNKLRCPNKSFFH